MGMVERAKSLNSRLIPGKAESVTDRIREGCDLWRAVLSSVKIRSRGRLDFGLLRWTAAPGLAISRLEAVALWRGMRVGESTTGPPNFWQIDR